MSGPDSHEDGAATSVFLALDPALSSTSGAYFVRCARAKTAAQAQSADDALRLWQASAAAVGVDVI